MIHNERTKLTANWLNAITGVVAPSIAVLFQLSMGIGVSPLLLVAASGVWLSSGIALHLLGRKVLGRLM